jgi:hypothetical protein
VRPVLRDAAAWWICSPRKRLAAEDEVAVALGEAATVERTPGRWRAAHRA